MLRTKFFITPLGFTRPEYKNIGVFRTAIVGLPETSSGLNCLALRIRRYSTEEGGRGETPSIYLGALSENKVPEEAVHVGKSP